MNFWAKRDEIGRELPLKEHMLDVAACFRRLIESGGYDRALRHAAGRPLAEGDLDRLSILAALHDVGKINARFQAGRGGHLLEGILVCEPRGAFGYIWSWGSPEAICQALCATFSHHGTVVWEGNCRIMADAHAGLVKDLSSAAMGWIDRTAKALHDAFPRARDADALPDAPAFWHLFAGLLTIADQVGSATEDFPLERTGNFARDPDRAIRDRGLDTRGLYQPSGVSPANAFGWPERSRPTPMQAAMLDLPLEDRLVLVESETGSGKTEAALLRFRKLAEAGAVSGMYFAIPTRSSAVQIQARVNESTESFWGMEAVLAVPGYLQAGSASGLKVSPFDVTWSDTGRIEPSRWAVEAPRKYLAAPIAVGTVDQALQAALMRKWAHMRGAALSRSLLVIDEVHASDAYMTELTMRLLRDHLRLGGHALLMSATLTTERRHQIFEACGALPETDRAPAAYPCVTSLRGDRQITLPVPATGRSKDVRIQLDDAMNAPERIAWKAVRAAAEGARVLVVRNSVKGAADVFRAVREIAPDAPLLTVGRVPTIHHSRFAAIDRKALDGAVERSLGKRSAEPVIVIGTQTLEQSLDIDADLLITDICPIDVLLQRIGRLHRHLRDNRPDGYRMPNCHVLFDPDASRETLRSHQIGFERAYPDLFMIEEVAKMIDEIPVWTIPEMNRYLVDRGARDDLLATEAGRDSQGRLLSMRRLAEHSMLNREMPIHAQSDFKNENSSRLGDMPVSLTLSPPVPSPLGAGVIDRIDVPFWMIDRNADVDGLASTEIVRADGRECIIIRPENGQTLVYGSLGLEKSSSRH